MWTQGEINYKCRTYKYCMKYFEEPSCFGYDEGRVSKLNIQRENIEVFNYDRGLDIDAVDTDTKAVLQMLLDKYN